MAVAWSLFSLGAAANMIPGEYTISNPNTLTKVKYNTEYSTRGDEFFEVYSPPIVSEYAQVFWTMMEAVPVPEEISKRFAGKTMAITGYEIDQVMKTDKGDVPVPINHAYNHHYVAWLKSEQAELKYVDADPHAAAHGYGHGANKYWTTVPKPGAPRLTEGEEVIQLSTVFSEGNGGEMRGSYHGYPPGYAQLINSPSTFHVNPMQIDTKNRDHPDGKFVAGPLPKAAQSPPGASYSGILECPCTDRLPKEIHDTYSTLDAGHCGADSTSTPVKSAEGCFKAAEMLLAVAHYDTKQVADKSLPVGCSINAQGAGSAEVVFNTAGEASCDQSAAAHKFGRAESTVGLQLDLQDSGATITMTGPADAWFGAGLGTATMCTKPVADECQQRPYAILIDGETVTERYLAEGSEHALQPSITVKSNTVQGGTRTVVLTRALKGLTDDHYSFDLTASAMSFINAKGSSLTYTTWPSSSFQVGDVTFVQSGAPTCVCETGQQGTLGGAPFHKSCPPPPLSDLGFQHNPTCSIETYVGGLSCCRHLNLLLDKDQTAWPGNKQEYHLKYRFYFQEFNQKHKGLVRLYHQTEFAAGEYDIVKCKPGTPPELCVQTITSRWSVQSMMNACDAHKGEWCSGIGSNDPTKTEGIQLIYAGPHCHAPSCISMELYNANTGELLCGMYPGFGTGTEVYNEEGYLRIPPCVWGNPEDGAMPPVLLTLDTQLLSIKKNNNTYGHYGEMASWQMRGIVVPKGGKLDMPVADLHAAMPDFHV